MDLVRGADVWLMLFVNEMAGVKDTPAFLRHLPATADGMTITDVVFPAFLFITGMAIPLALGARLSRGDSRAAVWRHVLGRTAILLVLGVLMISAEHASANAILPPAAWNLLMTAAVVPPLAWFVILLIDPWSALIMAVSSRHAASCAFGPSSDNARAMRTVCSPASFIAKVSPLAVT